MPSLRNLPLSLSILAFMAHLGQCAAPTGPANITVIDTTTGVTLGCLNATAQVVPTTECAEFDAAGGQGMGLIEVFDSATGTFNFLGFQIGTPDILVTSESLALADEWSIQGNVLQTEPEGRVFQEVGTTIESGATGGTSVSLVYTNILNS